MPSLNAFESWRRAAIALRCRWLGLVRGIKVAPSARLSFAARLISGERGSISIGEQTVVALQAIVVSRTSDGRTLPVSIGRNCFVGAGAIILPGVNIENGTIVAAGSVVFENVASGTIVAGNPAHTIKAGVEIDYYGRLPYSWENSAKYWRPDDLLQTSALKMLLAILESSSKEEPLRLQSDTGFSHRLAC